MAAWWTVQEPWQHGGQGPWQQEEGGAITSYGAGCAQFVGSIPVTRVSTVVVGGEAIFDTLGK